MKKICFFTGTRAEYGLLKPLIEELKNEKSIHLQLIISGMHLSPEFGLTYKEIDTKSISDVEKVEVLLSSDSPIGVSKAMGLGMISYAEALDRLKPDLIFGLGDRFELFAAVSVANVMNIPVAHIHGGELTFGAFDESFRHSITKMSHLHFTSTEEYRKRVIQLGEHPKRVFNVGALGIDNIKNMKLFSLKELEKSISFKLDNPFFVVTFHPVTLEKDSSVNQIKEVLKAIDFFKYFKIIITKPNADNEGRSIIKLIDDYVENNKERVKVFTSLGQLRYLSTLKHAEMVIGNSSSGIIEMPFFKKPTINIGNRQKGRIFTDSIIQCNPEKDSIVKAIKKGLEKDFKVKCRKNKNLYGNGNTARKIKNILLKQELDNLIHKEFYNIKVK